MRLITVFLGVFGHGALAAYGAGDTSGCGMPHTSGKTREWRVMSSGLNRTYHVHVPGNYSSKQQHPVILGFHGRGNTGLSFEETTGLSQEQYTPDTIMVYPDGVDNTWAGANYSALTVKEDLVFVWDLLKQLRRKYCVDNTRVYATGHSNGGGFTNVIACDPIVGSEFAAFAPVSGAFYDNTKEDAVCRPAKDLIPMLEIHGGEDPTIPYKGGKGEGGRLLPIPQWLKGWVSRDSCTNVRSRDDEELEHVTWGCRSKPGILEHYKVKQGVHEWFSTGGERFKNSTSENAAPIDASTIVTKFLKKFDTPYVEKNSIPASVRRRH